MQNNAQKNFWIKNKDIGDSWFWCHLRCWISMIVGFLSVGNRERSGENHGKSRVGGPVLNRGLCTWSDFGQVQKACRGGGDQRGWGTSWGSVLASHPIFFPIPNCTGTNRAYLSIRQFILVVQKSSGEKKKKIRAAMQALCHKVWRKTDGNSLITGSLYLTSKPLGLKNFTI